MLWRRHLMKSTKYNALSHGQLISTSNFVRTGNYQSVAAHWRQWRVLLLAERDTRVRVTEQLVLFCSVVAPRCDRDRKSDGQPVAPPCDRIIARKTNTKKRIYWQWRFDSWPQPLHSSTACADEQRSPVRIVDVQRLPRSQQMPEVYRTSYICTSIYTSAKKKFLSRLYILD